MEIFESVMFALLCVLCVFFVICGIQFSRGRWLGLVFKEKTVPANRSSSKKNSERREKRALKRREEERLAVGARLSYVMFAAAFAAGLQILSQVLVGLDIQPLATVMFGLTLVSYLGVFVLFFRTVRKIQGR